MTRQAVGGPVAAAVAATATAADARTFTASGRRSRRNGEAMASVAGTANRIRVTAQARERLCIECMPSCGGPGLSDEEFLQY